MTLDEYIKADKEDDNTFRRLSLGEMKNLLDEAIELLHTYKRKAKSHETVYRTVEDPYLRWADNDDGEEL